MFIDTDLLRMGADFSRSAGDIAKRGADQFAAAQLPAGIFGDFDSAHEFHHSLRRAHDSQVITMRGHHGVLSSFAERADSGAEVFDKGDEAGASAVRSAEPHIS